MVYSNDDVDNDDVNDDDMNYHNHIITYLPLFIYSKHNFPPGIAFGLFSPGGREETIPSPAIFTKDCDILSPSFHVRAIHHFIQYIEKR